VPPLLDAIAANHQAWFRRCGGQEVLDDVIVSDGHGTLAFPRVRTPEALDAAMRLGLRSMSCWSLDEDGELGAQLVARGFEWGWQPHWMALDLQRVPDRAPRHTVVAAPGDAPRDVPYAGEQPVPPPARHLAVVESGRTVGHVVVNPWRGFAGIYDMGVAPSRRRRGIGLDLTLAACRLARELGCSHALLNATGEGEPLYRAAGFESLGKGQTWWLHPGRAR
jgi:ribosomal protein S18 acetylase RimI-like enzyme